MEVQAALRQSLADLRARIEAARARGAHAAPQVTLVVVTKSAPPAVLPHLLLAGVTDVGENRVQAAEERRPRTPPGLVWHGIGHLQRNKAARAVDLFDVFHALDSPRLAEHLESVLARAGRLWPVYIQVNAAADPAKGGLAVEETVAFVKDVLRHPHLACRGFMTMARLDAGEAGARAAFRALREVRDEVRRRGLGDPPPEGLSMGMSDDFEWAVEEGSTVVRVGRAVFAGLPEEGP